MQRTGLLRRKAISVVYFMNIFSLTPHIGVIRSHYYELDGIQNLNYRGRYTFEQISLTSRKM